MLSRVVPVRDHDLMDGGARPTGTVAFLFTDVEGSTEAWQAEPDAMGAAVVRLAEILDGAAAAGRRAVEQGAGDSAVIAFDRAGDAAAAALVAQQAIGAEPWPTSRPLRVRMALHLGEVETGRDGSYRGTTMNRCGRLLGAAHGGQVVASGSFVTVLGESDSRAAPEGISWIDLGAHRLRGIAEPMRIWQLAHAGLDAEHPALRTPEGRGLRLPGTTSTLIGRDADLERLEGLVGTERLVTVVGSGGSGKTRLVVEMAHRALDRVDDVGWVDLAKVTGTQDVDALVVAELALHHGPEDLRRRIVDHLRAREQLLVLDNCEHVLAAAADLVGELVTRCPALRVVTTSREPLEAAGEVTLRLGPLGVPADPEGADLRASDAGRLFTDRVARVRPTTRLSDADLEAAAEICRRLDGIPLALELAAARARSMPLPVVASRLGQRFALLAGGTRSALARQRTLEASVAWSYDLLHDLEQAALRHLSTFAGPFDLPAAGAVIEIADPDAGGRDPIDLVAALVDKSLLIEEPDGDRPRYRMLETIRFYARDRCVQAGEATGCRTRHLEWVTSEAERASSAFEGAGAADAVRRMDEIIEDVRAAMEWASGSGLGTAVSSVAAMLGWYWVWRGLAGEGWRWLERAALITAADGTDEDPALAARIGFARHLAVTHRLQTHDEIELVANEAIEAAVAARDRDLEARCRLLLGTHHSFHDPVAHRADVEAAAAMCREHGGPFWSAMADGHLAQGIMFRLRLRDAVDLVESAERHARRLGNHQLAAESISRRCAIAEGLGDYDAALDAMRDLDRALAGVATHENRAIALRSVALVRLRRGDVDGVIADLRRAVDEYLRDEDLQFVPLLVGPLADALTASGHPEEAVALLAPWWDHPEIRAARVYAGVLAAPYVTALGAAGERERARDVAADAAEVADVIGSDVLGAWMAGLVAGFDLDDGAPASAEAPLHDALEVFREHGHRQLVCDALEELARLELDFARPGTAAVLLGGAARERDEQAVVMRPGRQPTYLATVERVRTELGDAEAAARAARGRELPLEDVVALARRGRGERTRPSFGWDGLTDTERHVARLAAEGLSNPQIAERLVVGRETVKTHMASVLRKLGLVNRVELAALVANRPED